VDCGPPATFERGTDGPRVIVVGVGRQPNVRERVRVRGRGVRLADPVRDPPGDPFIELRDTATAVRADLVVVGVSTRFGHRFLGSVALRLVRLGCSPVVVVP
jgi:nucleotide-binding universal stress UspA family protein